MPTSAVTVCATALSLEAQVLCCSVRTNLDAPHVVRLRALLQANLDWPALLRMATQHGVLPLLAWYLPTTCADAVPTPICQQLRTAFHAQALYSQRWRPSSSGSCRSWWPRTSPRCITPTGAAWPRL